VSDSVDQLITGTTYLRVPLLGNAIQVGTCLSLPAATIALRKTQLAAQVCRTDGNPLRVQIVNVGADRSTTRTDVFAAPPDVLRLRRTRRSDGTQWWVVADVPAYRDCDVLQLIETIISFAVAKQHRAKAG
jgi:hypothetical protein